MGGGVAGLEFDGAPEDIDGLPRDPLSPEGEAQGEECGG
jgi:hypothetical protein